MYSLWWPNYIVPTHVSKVAKSVRVVCEKHNKCAQVSHIITIWEMRKSITFTHNHNCLMGTITFEVHHMTLTSPKNTFTIILKAFRFFLLLIFFTYSFSFWAYHAWAYKGERRNTQLCKLNITILLCRSI